MPQAGHSANDPAVGHAVDVIARLERRRTFEPLVATPGARIVSRLVDFALAVVFLVILGGITTVVSVIAFPWQQDGYPRHPSLGEYIFAGVAGFIALAGLVLNEVVLVGRTGQTLGKKAMGIFVVDQRGEPPGMARAVWRLLIWTVPLAACLGLWALVIGNGPLTALAWVASAGALALPLWLVVGPAHRGLHDRLCGTRVIEPQ